jgi:hypothetical protein
VVTCGHPFNESECSFGIVCLLASTPVRLLVPPAFPPQRLFVLQKADGLRGNRFGQNSLDSHAIDPLRSGDDSTQCWKSVLSIAFQFAYEPHSEEAVAAVARQYVRSVVGSVQRVAMALAPTCIKVRQPNTQGGMQRSRASSNICA